MTIQEAVAAMDEHHIGVVWTDANPLMPWLAMAQGRRDSGATAAEHLGPGGCGWCDDNFAFGGRGQTIPEAVEECLARVLNGRRG